jgi:hypothetical protein
MRLALLVALCTACGDNVAGPDALIAVDAAGSLFGEPCTQPPAPEIGICHEGEGACNDEAGGSVCRPFCHVEGVPQCAARQGIERVTDRGACVCVPP